MPAIFGFYNHLYRLAPVIFNRFTNNLSGFIGYQFKYGFSQNLGNGITGYRLKLSIGVQYKTVFMN
jgi:hypothetical protein